MSEQRWKKFEQAVFEIQKHLSPNSQIIHDYKVMGFRSKVDRQVDIALFDTIGQFKFFIAIECKDFIRPIDVKKIESCASMFSDIRANKGVVVSSNGFTKAAINTAIDYNIELFTLMNAKKDQWPENFNIPFIIEVKRMDAYSVEIAAPSSGGVFSSPDFSPSELMIYASDNMSLGKLKTFVEKAWNSSELSDDNGRNLHTLNNIKIYHSGQFFEITLKIHYVVISRYYKKQVKVTELTDFENVIEGNLVSKFISTENIDVDIPQMDETWGEINQLRLLNLYNPDYYLKVREIYSE